MIIDLPKAVRGMNRLHTPRVESVFAEALTVLAELGNMGPTVRPPEQPDLLGNYQPWAADSFSDEEVLRMTGTLPTHRIERLIDDSDRLHSFDGMHRQLTEAANQFPAEDFMHEVTASLNDVLKLMKKDSEARRGLTAALALMGQQLQSQYHSTEHGLGEIESAMRTLIEAGLVLDDKPTANRPL